MVTDRIRVASLQYFVRPVQSFEQFRDQVESLVETAADYKCHLLVFPEYFTVQLLRLGNVKGPIDEQMRDLAKQVPRFVELVTFLARKHRLYILAGTIPVTDDSSGPIYNDAFFFRPSGDFAVQGKLHMTRFEAEDWKIEPAQHYHSLIRNSDASPSPYATTWNSRGLLAPRHARVLNGELKGFTLSFQLKHGFRVLAVVPGYLAHDPESRLRCSNRVDKRISHQSGDIGRNLRFAGRAFGTSR